MRIGSACALLVASATMAQMAALRAAFVVTTLAALTGITLAQGLERMLGTLSAEAQPVFTDGRLNGCTVVFGALAKDFTYKQGGYITVNGSFGIMSAKAELAATLKVVVHDTDPRTNSLTPSPPTSAYFVSGAKTTKSAVVGQYPSDTPGAIFVVLRPETVLPILTKGLERSKVTIAFAREQGGMDIQLPIDTSVVETKPNGQRTHSPQAMLNFYECITQLGDSVLDSPTTNAAPDERR
jgi:hypothetical protein